MHEHFISFRLWNWSSHLHILYSDRLQFVLLRCFYIHVRIEQVGFFAWLHQIWKQIV